MTMSVRIARTFADGAGIGQLFESEQERLRVAAFLSSGTAILATTATVRDALEPGRGEVVPISVRSDGAWVWSDAHAYYAEQHGIAPEVDFYEHIKAQGYRCRQLDSDEVERVLEAFYAAAG